MFLLSYFDSFKMYIVKYCHMLVTNLDYYAQ
jgi:hypothetical protein